MKIPRHARAENLPVPSQTFVRIFVIALLIVAVALFIWVSILVVAASHRADHATSTVQTTARRVENLTNALSAQRQQFVECTRWRHTGARPTRRNPACQSPVSPPAHAIGPTGATGASGAIGPQGPQGPQGVPGLPGRPGPRGEPGGDGTDGTAGRPGTSVTGAPGATGPAGKPGADGAPGPKGDPGPPGPAGADGKPGADGAPGAKGDPGPAGPAGYPDAFSFTGPDGTSYTCTDPDNDHAYTCAIPAVGS